MIKPLKTLRDKIDEIAEAKADEAIAKAEANLKKEEKKASRSKINLNKKSDREAGPKSTASGEDKKNDHTKKGKAKK